MTRLLGGAIARRLLLGLLATALLPLLLLTLWGSHNTSAALRERVTDNLHNLVNSRAAQVELYVRERRRDINALASTPTVVDALRSLSQAMATAGPGSVAIERARTLIRPFLANYAELSGYKDMLLIDATGQVLFALNALEQLDHHYRSSPDQRLGWIFDRATTLLETEISAFERQPDSPWADAYIAAPIFHRKVIIGVMVFHLNSQPLYQILTERRGLGQSGEMIVGFQDGESIRITAPLRHDADAAFIRTLAQGADHSQALQRAVRGEQGSGEDLDYRGVVSIAAWRYLPSLRWGIVIKQDRAEALASVYQQQRLTLIAAGLSTMLIVVIAMVIARSLSAPVEQLTRAVEALSVGDLRVRLPERSQDDEIGILTRGFNQMASHLDQLVDSLEERISERTHSLELAREEAERSNRAKSVFLANMSHELRTPLNAILGFTQVLERDAALGERQQNQLGIISRSGQHLLGLINDVLAISKIEAGQMQLQPQPFDLQLLFQSTEEMFHLPCQSKGLQYLFEVDDSVPRYVMGDESKLRQVLINLLGNAIKFTTEGGVALRARYQSEQLYVEVEDTGEGIDAKELSRLFQPFTQTSTGTNSQEGTGLGLAISQQFISLMEGDIQARSTPGQGSVFAFHLSLPPSGAPITTHDERRVVGLADTVLTRRVLVVDDKFENRELLLIWLETVGFEVREAVNGAEAVAQCQAWQPDLIWMDMRMPVMNGYEATRRIKAATTKPPVIIALTASAFEHERSLVLAAGCDDFVPKPVREATIFAKMVEHLGIDLIYADGPPAVALSSQHLDARWLATLPAPLLTHLRQAVAAVDIMEIQTVIDHINTTDPALATALQGLVKEFRFDTLHDLLAEDLDP